MKTIFIPKGETVRYESLTTENLIVKGALHVENGICARHISGNGVISVGSISADTIRATELESAHITCKRLLAERVVAVEVIASESAAVSCYLTAALVRTGRLTVSVSQISEVDAQQVINLPVKNRSLFGTLLASAFRAFWLPLVAPKTRGEVLDAEYEPVQEAAVVEPEPVAPVTIAAPETESHDDFELQRIIAQFKLARESGYTLKLIPGTPEENAPVFDFDAGQILRPAA